MAIKDLLAVIDTGDKDEQFIRDALSFADFHEARIAFLVLAVVPSPDYALSFTSPYVILDDFTEALAAKEKRVAELTRLSSVEVRTFSDQAAVQARYADMVLFGPVDSYVYPLVRRDTIESILFASGRPVMILPNGHVPGRLDHLAIGWNATRESTHALRDATTFAAPGAKVDVLVLDPRPTSQGHGSDPGADIARHLARHEFSATVLALESAGRSDAQALVDAARQQGAGLLALGAYGHSRLRQMILGGVTRDLLAGADLPLFFSH